MFSSTQIAITLLFLLHSLPSAFTRPQLSAGNATAIAPYKPGYATASPVDEMSLAVYAAEGPHQSNTFAPCSGFVALNYSAPLPSSQSGCIAGIAASTISSAPALNSITCVADTQNDIRLDACTVVGYLDKTCGSSPVQTQLESNGWAFVAVGDVQSFKVDCSGASGAL